MTAQSKAKLARIQRTPSAQAGLTLVELLVSLTLGLLVIMAATALMVSSKSGYATLDDSTRLHDTGRYALDLVARAVHQASYANWDTEGAPVVASAADSADISGYDAKSLSATSADIQAPLPRAVNGSDVLALRYFGSGSGTNGDGTVLNCAGFGVPAAQLGDSPETSRAWSIFFVALDQNGEPELRCKYRGRTSWASQAVASGVESFQVLYGIDTDTDGLPNQYVTANELEQLDQLLELDGDTAEARAISKNKKTNWKKIVAIKVALLVRGTQKVRSDALTKQYELFGPDYGRLDAHDSGTVINEIRLPSQQRNRIRKVFQQTYMLRNRAVGNNA